MNDFPQLKDRRTAERRSLRVTANIASADQPSEDVRTVDISADSVGIVAHFNPQPGTVFRIRLKLPTLARGLIALESHAQVVHSILSGDEGGFKIGLMFSGADTARDQAIKSYLEQP